MERPRTAAEDADRFSYIRLQEYQQLPDEAQEWLQHEPLPEEFLRALEGQLAPHHTVTELMRIIRQVLRKLYGSDERKAQSFEESRFSALEEIISNRLSSCGAKATVFAEALRAAGIPVKYVHGWFLNKPRDQSGDRHAWLKIYDPVRNEWIARDPTESNFEKRTDVGELKEYHSWAELYKDYLNGEW